MATFADVDDKIAFCFISPNESPTRHARDGRVSVLYLLRRELIETAGYDPNTDDENTVDVGGIRNRLFVSLIAMFTAFDLLAKFQRGDGEFVGTRFKAFLTSLAGTGMATADADLFYAVRCSLTHAFGVPDADSLAKLGLQGVELRQRVQMKNGGMLVVSRNTWARSHTVAQLYIDGVFTVLMTKNYQGSLAGSVDARQQFDLMFDKYGTIIMA